MGIFGSILLVSLGGAAGSLLRFGAAQLWGARPLTTFAVNVSGAFLIGALAAVVEDPKIRLLIGTGVLGGFTTFSAWQLEAWNSARLHDWASALLNLAGSAVAGFGAVALGYALGIKLRS